MSEVADVSEPSITSSVNASEGNTAEPHLISEEPVKPDAGSGAAGDENVSCAEDMMTEKVEGSTTEGLGINVDPGVKDTLDGLKDPTPLEGDVLDPSVVTLVEGMDAKILCVADTEPVTAKAADENIQEIIPEETGPKKKSKKRKHNKGDNVGEFLVPRTKLNKEEKVAKKARKAQKRARRAAQEVSDAEAAEDDVPKNILLAQNEYILTTEDTEEPYPGVITISPKLMEGTHVANVPLAHVADEGASGSGTDGTAQLLRDEIRYLDGIIQSSLAIKSVLEAHLRSLSGEDDSDVDPTVSDGGAETPWA
ncbi:hypothetical protein LIER_13213 [Lithospermum erythrorhizon]|uniref:Uncharacterized protein n=1 Tax=Lithospermum erythrorhizon TaxID=34254 RepID=A0AAV3PVH9_LITER